MKRNHSSPAFTLIELLVVIAIIAILAVVVVLTLNPAQLLAQSRDANRVSDMATLNSALNLYTVDAGGTGSLGTSSIVYTSLSDTSSTCGNLGLPVLPSGYTYNCTVSTSTRNINTTGWIPVNFQNISSGAPFGSLPVDPVNTSSSGLYYTYSTSNGQFEVTALPESQKQKSSLGAKPMIPNYPDVIANGSSLTINPLFNQTGLVVYWPMDEGNGSSTINASGNGNNGTWSGTPAGTSGYYSPGKVGNWAGTFDGSTDYIVSSLTIPWGVNGSFSFWLNPTAAQIATSTWSTIVSFYSNAAIIWQPNLHIPYVQFCSGGCFSITDLNNNMSANTWYFITTTWSQFSGSSSTLSYYHNGKLVRSTIFGSPNANSAFSLSAVSTGFNGLIDDVRIYNRALSAAEIQALYNAQN